MVPKVDFGALCVLLCLIQNLQCCHFLSALKQDVKRTGLTLGRDTKRTRETQWNLIRNKAWNYRDEKSATASGWRRRDVHLTWWKMKPALKKRLTVPKLTTPFWILWASLRTAFLQMSLVEMRFDTCVHSTYEICWCSVLANYLLRSGHNHW